MLWYRSWIQKWHVCTHTNLLYCAFRTKQSRILTQCILNVQILILAAVLHCDAWIITHEPSMLVGSCCTIGFAVRYVRILTLRARKNLLLVEQFQISLLRKLLSKDQAFSICCRADHVVQKSQDACNNHALYKQANHILLISVDQNLSCQS